MIVYRKLLLIIAFTLLVVLLFLVGYYYFIFFINPKSSQVKNSNPQRLVVNPSPTNTQTTPSDNSTSYSPYQDSNQKMIFPKDIPSLDYVDKCVSDYSSKFADSFEENDYVIYGKIESIEGRTVKFTGGKSYDLNQIEKKVLTVDLTNGDEKIYYLSYPLEEIFARIQKNDYLVLSKSAGMITQIFLRCGESN